MTLPNFVRLGMWTSLTLLGGLGCGDKEDDSTVVDDTDADTDTDTDSDTDSDTDTDTEVFEDYAVFMNFRLAVADDALSAYNYEDENGDLQEVTPYVEMTIAEEAYFDAYDDKYTCTWYGYVVENGLDDLQADVWIGWDVSFLLIDTDCENFDPEIWGEETPTTKIEEVQFGIGFGELGGDFKTSVQSAFEDAGYDWENEYAPYVIGMYLAAYDPDSGALAGGQANIAYAYEMEDDGALISDADGNLIPYDISTATEMPQPSFVFGPAFYGYYTTIFTE